MNGPSRMFGKIKHFLQSDLTIAFVLGLMGCIVIYSFYDFRSRVSFVNDTTNIRVRLV